MRALACAALCALLPAVAAAEELSVEARQSVYADEWLTARNGDLYKGGQRIDVISTMADYGDQWVGRFQLIPAAHEQARHARHLQQVHIGAWWGQLVFEAGFLVTFFRGAPLGLPGYATALSALAVSGLASLIVGLVAGSGFRTSFREALNTYNDGLNRALPPDQQLDVLVPVN